MWLWKYYDSETTRLPIARSHVAFSANYLPTYEIVVHSASLEPIRKDLGSAILKYANMTGTGCSLTNGCCLK